MAARVLIVEDNQANMDLMCYLLEAFGHQPLSAFDGEQGVAAALEHRPDLIVCDIHLPRLDGYGVVDVCLLYTSPSPRDRQKSRMPSSA